jgi:hypothetical protein
MLAWLAVIFLGGAFFVGGIGSILSLFGAFSRSPGGWILPQRLTTKALRH